MVHLRMFKSEIFAKRKLELTIQLPVYKKLVGIIHGDSSILPFSYRLKNGDT